MQSEAMPSRKHQPPEGLTFDQYDPTPSDPYHHGEVEKLKPGWSHHLMRAWMPGGYVEGSDKHQAGTIMYSRSPEGHQPPTVAVHRMLVGEDERGRGIASAMQDELHRQHPNHFIDHGDRSDAGIAWWKQYETPVGHPNAELPEGDRLLGRTDPDPAINHEWHEREAAMQHTAISWDEVGERHLHVYGDEEVHGDAARGADGEGIGWAASQLAHSRPDDPDVEGSGSWDLHFHEERVDPKHIDYARHGLHDPRVRSAYDGYKSGSNVPPLVLVHRHGVYQVADGHHRAEAAHHAGVKVPAYVHYSEYPDEPFGDGDKAPYHGAETTEGMRHESVLNDEVPWCAHLYHGNCTYPGDKLPNGFVLGIPQDRGPCPWKRSAFQQAACPISDPGPMAVMQVSAGQSGELPENFRIEYADHGGRHHLRALDGDTAIGGLTWLKHGNPNFGVPPGEVHNIWTDQDYQRRGVASALWNAAHASDVEPKPVHSPDDQSEDGAAWAQHVGMSHIAEGDYRMQHQAPSDSDDVGAPLHNVEEMMPDFYSHPHYYHAGQDNFWDSANTILSAKDQPEKRVRVYRSLPAEHAHEGFHTGDWVTTSKDYARTHGSQQDPKDDWPTISTHVPAKHLYTEGDVHEWGYTGPEINSGHTVAFKGGHNQEVRQRADGTIKKVQRKPVQEKPFKDWDIKHYPGNVGHDDENHTVVAYDPDDNWAGRIRKHKDGEDVEVEPQHQNTGLEEHMRSQFPPHLSALDRDFSFHFTATWADVRAKAKRLRAEGAVRIASVTVDGVTGEVKGEHHIYETGLNFVPGSHKVGAWECGCKWSAYAWGRSPAYKRFEGRMCSHALAMQYEAQARGMFGREITEDQRRPDWMKAHSPVVIQYERPSDKHPSGIDLTRRAVPPGNMRRTWGSLDPDGIYPDDHALDLSRSPASMVAEAVLEATNDPAEVIRSLTSFGMAHHAAQRTLRIALGEDVPHIGAAMKRCPECHASIAASATRCPECGAVLGDAPVLHEAAEDARAHAHEFGQGVPQWNAGPLKDCSQCRGHGCGHCGGTGQVIDGENGTEMNAVPDQNDDAGDAISDTGMSFADGNTISMGGAKKTFGPSVAGVALKAADTGRVLMLQRGLDDPKDPAAGTWEFPGGHKEPGDKSSVHAGIREWEEEVGQPFPEDAMLHHSWTSPNGIYQGHVMVIPEERSVVMHDGRIIPNPDDPKGDMAEQAAWWNVDHARKNPALRPEVKTGTPWNKLRAAGQDLQKSATGQFEKMYHSSPAANRHSISQNGLDVDYDQGEGNTAPGIYMSPHATDNPFEDQWEVNTRGMHLHPDDPYQMQEFQDQGGSYYSQHSIPAEHVRLHAPATKHWTEGSRREADHAVNDSSTAVAPEYSVRQDNNGPTFEAHVNGKNVGYLTTHDKGDHVFFDGLYVHPDHRGGGLGRQLMQQGMDYHQGRTLALKPDPYHEEGEQVPGVSADTLQRFYHSMGFQPTGEYMTKQADYAVNDPFSAEESNPVDPPPHSRATNPASTGFATSYDPEGWNGQEPFGGRDDAPMASYQADLHVVMDTPQRYSAPAPVVVLPEVRGMWNEGTIPVIMDRSGTLQSEPEGALPYTDGDQDQDPYADSNNPYTGDSGDGQGEIPGLEDEGSPSSVTASREDEYDPAVADIVARFQATAAAGSLMSSGGGRSGGREGFNDIAGAAQAFLGQRTALKDFNFSEQQELINEHRGGARARNTDNLQIQGTHYELLDQARGADSLASDDLFV